MNKKILLVLVIAFAGLCAPMLSATDAFVFTDVSDARLLSIDTAGNTNATGWLAEEGVKLVDIYLTLSGGTLTGDLTMAAGYNITLGTGGYIISGGEAIDFSGINSSWNQEAADLLYTNEAFVVAVNATMKIYVDAQDVVYNDSMAAYVDTEVAGVSVSMDYTNIGLTNQTNTFTEEQTFSSGILTDTVTAESAGAITFKAGV